MTRPCPAVAGCIGLILFSVSQKSYSQTEPVPELEGIGIEQKLESEIPLDLVFVDETGKPVQLRQLFGDRPVLLTLVYYECPMLCTMILNGVLKTIKALSFDVGDEFDIVTISFDPRETSDLAAGKKGIYLKKYARDGAETGWHFLTGDEQAIRNLTDAVGFHYKFDPNTSQFIHASGIILLTPTGKISKYFYGIEYSPRDLRLGIIEAAENKIGTFADQVLLYCYHYDPSTGKYGVAIMNIIRVLGSATVICLGSFMFVMLRRDKRQKQTIANKTTERL